MECKFKRIDLDIGFTTEFIRDRELKCCSWYSFCREILASHIREYLGLWGYTLDLSPNSKNSIIFLKDTGGLRATKLDWDTNFLLNAEISLNAFVGIVSTILFRDKDEYIRRMKFKKENTPYIYIKKTKNSIALHYDLVSQRMYLANPIFSLIMLMAVIGISVVYDENLFKDLTERINPKKIEEVIFTGDFKRAKEIWKRQIRPLLSKWHVNIARNQIKQFIDVIESGIEKLIDKRYVDEYWKNRRGTYGILSFTNALKRDGKIDEKHIKIGFKRLVKKNG